MSKHATCTRDSHKLTGQVKLRSTFRGWLGAAALLACGLAPSIAHAATCVVLDETKDGLSPEDQKAARTLFEEALSEAQVSVAQEGCTETWTLYHVRLGESVTVVVQSPTGTRRERVKNVEDLPGTYSQLTRSLLSGTENSSSGANLDRRNVTASQSERRRVKADAIWYGKLGYGMSPAVGFNAGPAFGFGRRWELDHVGINLGFLNFIMYQNPDGFDGTSAGWIELGADYFFDAYANSTLYVGGGLSLGSHSLHDDDVEGGDYGGTGLQGKASLGYEMFRASTIRLLVQVDATLPMFRLSREVYDDVTQTLSRDRVYAPTLTLCLGLGWGSRSN
jgi:hypothetical protein